jgi:TMEM175 potassium channel family protein
MSKGRLEAFSDGVIAILITIMVLSLAVPRGEGLESLAPLAPVFLSYVLSFVFLGIYWSNHHHMLQAVQRVNGAILWCNLYLLFWLSLVPFVTAWMGQNHFGTWAVALYGVVLLMSGIAYYILSQALIRYHGQESALAKAVGSDFKGRISIVLYAAAIGFAFWNRWAALGIYVLVAVMWLIPDRRIEKALAEPR